MQRKKIIKWLKAHKKELKFLGIGVGAAILIVLGIRNREALRAYWISLTKLLAKPKASTETATKVSEGTIKAAGKTLGTALKTEEAVPFKVRGHVRTLPKGWHASPDKIASAPFELAEGQTWVADYMKGIKAA